MGAPGTAADRTSHRPPICSQDSGTITIAFNGDGAKGTWSGHYDGPANVATVLPGPSADRTNRAR